MSQPPYPPPYDPNYTPPRRRTNPWTIVAIVVASCAGVALVSVAVLAALLFPAFSRARDAARGTSCKSNLTQLSVGVQMYVQDYDETYPPANAWQEGLKPYLAPRDASGESHPPAGLLECPSRKGVLPGYAFNRNLAEKGLDKIFSPNQTPVLFESSLGAPNASDALTSFVKPHRDQGNVGFADGSVRSLEQAPPAGIDGK